MLIAGIIATVLLVFFGVGYCLLGYNLHFLNWVIDDDRFRKQGSE